MRPHTLKYRFPVAIPESALVGCLLAMVLLGAACGKRKSKGASSPAHKTAGKRPALAQSSVSASLAKIIKRDLLRFSGDALPAQLVAWLRKHRVVLLGEVHQIREHNDLLFAVLSQLHASGTHLLMLEGAQSESWLTDQFVMGKSNTLPPLAHRYMHPILTKLKHFNTGLPTHSRVHVRMIDINHRDWSFPNSLSHMAERGLRNAATDRFLASIGLRWQDADATKKFTAWRKKHSGTYDKALKKLEADLLSKPPPKHHILLHEMTRIARKSLFIRNIWETRGENQAHPQREEVINTLIERALKQSKGPVLLNMGGYHAQLKHIMGTPKVWVGEYLRTVSPQAAGSVASIYVALAKKYRGNRLTFSVAKNTVAGELFSLMSHRAGAANAFLPLRDPVFSTQIIPVNYGGHVVRHRPSKQFDAFVLLRSGHTWQPPPIREGAK